jgi:hypothetical protein
MTAIGSKVNITQHDYIGVSFTHAGVFQSKNSNMNSTLTAGYLIIKPFMAMAQRV